jgi:hypothetical protein
MQFPYNRDRGGLLKEVEEAFAALVAQRAGAW